MGARLFLSQLIYPSTPPPPFHSPAQDQRGGEETASKLTQGPERRRREGEGGSQLADPCGREVGEETGGRGVTGLAKRREGEQHQDRRGVSPEKDLIGSRGNIPAEPAFTEP